MTVTLAPAVKTQRLIALRDAIDTGAGTARLILYDGTRPAGGGPATTALAAIDLPAPCGTVAGDTLTLALPAEENADAAGTITWARITDRDGNWVIDMGAGDDPAEDLHINPAAVYAGGIIRFLDDRLIE